MRVFNFGIQEKCNPSELCCLSWLWVEEIIKTLIIIIIILVIFKIIKSSKNRLLLRLREITQNSIILRVIKILIIWFFFLKIIYLFALVLFCNL